MSAMVAMRQTVALAVDAYRELNAKKLFWLAVGLSGLVVVVQAGLSLEEGGIGFFGLSIPAPGGVLTALGPRVFHSIVFVSVGVQIWLAWVSTGMALVSTAGIIPDAIGGGAIESTLSRPISRWRFFLTKYACGLMFVAVQVGVVAVGSLVVIGVRAGHWEPRVLLAVPIVVVFFSSLYCVCVLVGLLTRSAIASLLLTLLFWFVLFGLNTADGTLNQFAAAAEVELERTERRMGSMREGTAALLRSQRGAEPPAGAGEGAGAGPTEAQVREANPFYAQLEDRRGRAERELSSVRRWAGRVAMVRAVLPKTNETIALLERSLIDIDDMPIGGPGGDGADAGGGEDITRLRDPEASRRAEERLRARGLGWVLGTSIGFQAAVLGLCVVIFARRDF